MPDSLVQGTCSNEAADAVEAVNGITSLPLVSREAAE
jgi:hypothetical protein